jgi:magnesium chelatase family protein
VLAAVIGFAIDGLEPRRVVVEVDLRKGLPAFTVVGLADRAVREARERVHAAILNSGFRFPDRRATVSLAPASLRKVGPGFDLPIAVGLLAAEGVVPPGAVADVAVFGELGLDGRLRPCRGALAVAEGAARAGLRRLVVPREQAGEAALVEAVEVLGAANLCDVVAVLRGDADAVAAAWGAAADAPAAPPPGAAHPDLSDVRGHAEAIRALVVAAAGGHNLLMAGPPGVGKTMLARRLPGILPPLTRAEALEVTRVHSVAGLHAGGLVAERPFRAPHHQISPSGLVGGGSVPVPGEASLALHGVLFLDELSEFNRAALEALRQPLEDGSVTIVRGQRTAVFPSRFMLVAATNPCPCGWAPERRCPCTESDHARHRRRLSGPLLDRIDLVSAVGRPPADQLVAPPATTTAAERERVVAARERQQHRLRDAGVTCNAHLDARGLREHLHLEPGADAPLVAAYARGALSARGRDRVLRVARTLADLDGADRVSVGHVHTAVAQRFETDAATGAAAP